MKIIEIRDTQYGEVAYVFSEEDGKLYKLLVEDLTGFADTEEDKPPLRRLPRKKMRPVPMPTRDVEDDAQEELPLARPRVAPKSIIPSHLAGVFMKPGSPGAAEERREV